MKKNRLKPKSIIMIFLIFVSGVMPVVATTASMAEIQIKPIGINSDNDSILCKTMFLPNYEGGYSYLEAYFGLMIISQDGTIHEKETFYYNYYNSSKNNHDKEIKKLIDNFKKINNFGPGDMAGIDVFLNKYHMEKLKPVPVYHTKKLKLNDLMKTYDFEKQKTIRNYGVNRYYGNDLEVIFDYKNICIVRNKIYGFTKKGQKAGADFHIPNWFFYKNKMINREFDIYLVDGIVFKK